LWYNFFKIIKKGAVMSSGIEHKAGAGAGAGAGSASAAGSASGSSSIVEDTLPRVRELIQSMSFGTVVVNWNAVRTLQFWEREVTNIGSLQGVLDAGAGDQQAFLQQVGTLFNEHAWTLYNRAAQLTSRDQCSAGAIPSHQQAQEMVALLSERNELARRGIGHLIAATQQLPARAKQRDNELSAITVSPGAGSVGADGSGVEIGSGHYADSTEVALSEDELSAIFVSLGSGSSDAVSASDAEAGAGRGDYKSS
jgi:hypothetical protein